MGKRLLVRLGVSAPILWLASAGLYWWAVGVRRAIREDPRLETTIVPTLSDGLSISTKK